MFDDESLQPLLAQINEGGSAPSFEDPSGLSSSESPAPPIPPAETNEQRARRLAKKHKVDPNLIVSLMSQESRHKTRAKSWADARGPMQLMPGTARALGVTDIYDPEQNIDAGIRYYKQMLERYKDPKKALAAYNMGPKDKVLNSKDWWNKLQFISNDKEVQAGRKPRGASDKTNTQNYVKNIWSNYLKGGSPTEMNYEISEETAKLAKKLFGTPSKKTAEKAAKLGEVSPSELTSSAEPDPLAISDETAKLAENLFGGKGTVSGGAEIKPTKVPLESTKEPTLKDVNAFLKTQGKKPITEQQLKKQAVENDDFGSDVTVGYSGGTPVDDQGSALPVPIDGPIEVKTDSDILSAGTRTVKMDPDTPEDDAFAKALHTIGAEYDLSADQVNEFIDKRRAQGKTLQYGLTPEERAALKASGKQMGVTVDYKTINNLLGYDDGRLHPKLRQTVDMYTAENRQPKIDLNLPAMNEPEGFIDKFRNLSATQEQQEKFEADPLYQQAKRNLSGYPDGAAPNLFPADLDENEVLAEYKRLQSNEKLLDEEAVARGKEIGSQMGSMGGGNAGALSGGLNLVAGATQIFSKLGGGVESDITRGIRRLGLETGTAAATERETNTGTGSWLLRMATGLPLNLSRATLLIPKGAGASGMVVGFSSEGALSESGRGGTNEDILKAGGHGAVMGALFPAGKILGRVAGGGKAGLAVDMGTVFGGSAIAGGSVEAGIENFIIDALMKVSHVGSRPVYGVNPVNGKRIIKGYEWYDKAAPDPESLKNKIYYADNGKQQAYFTIKPDGSIVTVSQPPPKTKVTYLVDSAKVERTVADVSAMIESQKGKPVDVTGQVQKMAPVTEKSQAGPSMSAPVRDFIPVPGSERIRVNEEPIAPIVMGKQKPAVETSSESLEDTAPIPESQTAIDAQTAAAADPSQTKRIAVMFPKGSRPSDIVKARTDSWIIPLPNGDTVAVNKEGWKQKAAELGVKPTKSALVEYTKAGKNDVAVQDLLGRPESAVVESTEVAPGRAAVEATQDGKQVDATVVDTEQAAAETVDSMEQQYPDAEVSVKDSTEVAANRVADLESERPSMSKEAIVEGISRLNPNADMEATRQLLPEGEYEIKEIPLTDIKETMGKAGKAKVDDYSARDTEAPPIVVNDKGVVVDGKHRFAAAKKRGDKTIKAWVPKETKPAGLVDRFEQQAGRPATMEEMGDLLHGKPIEEVIGAKSEPTSSEKLKELEDLIAKQVKDGIDNIDSEIISAQDEIKMISGNIAEARAERDSEIKKIRASKLSKEAKEDAIEDAKAKYQDIKDDVEDQIAGFKEEIAQLKKDKKAEEKELTRLQAKPSSDSPESAKVEEPTTPVADPIDPIVEQSNRDLAEYEAAKTAEAGIKTDDVIYNRSGLEGEVIRVNEDTLLVQWTDKEGNSLGHPVEVKTSSVLTERPQVKLTKSDDLVEMGSGIPILSKLLGHRTRNDSVNTVGTIAARADIAAARAAMDAANGLKSTTMMERMRKHVTDVYNGFKRTFVNIDPNSSPEMAVSNDILRQQLAAPAAARGMVTMEIARITQNLGPQRLQIFAENLILSDLAKDVEAGRYDGKPIPFVGEAETLYDMLAENQALVDINPEIASAIAERNSYVDGLTNQLVAYDLLSPSVLADPRYFHRQVLDFMNTPQYAGVDMSGDLRVRDSGFQRNRTGSSRDFNTNYQEAEFEWMSQAVSKILRKQALDRLQQVNDLKPAMDAAARVESEATGTDVSWKRFIPDTHTIWQPKEGNFFYTAFTLPERSMNRLLAQEAELNEVAGDYFLEYENADGDFVSSRVREGRVMGGRRPEWVIPKNLAAELDTFNARDINDPMENAWTFMQNKWKQWTLLNPMKAAVYNLNNMSGDLDIALAYDPTILKYVTQAAKDSFNFNLRHKSTGADIDEALKYGVIESGLSIVEIPDIHRQDAMKMLTSNDSGLIMTGVDTVWGGIKNLTNARENVLRLAAFRYFKDQLAAGKDVYGASNRNQVIAIRRERGDTAAAAKLARELIGDYSAVSKSGRWIRRHMIPFYSWCVPIETEALTRNGWRFRKDLTVGTEVLTYNVQTHETEWQPVKDIADFDFNDDLHTLTNKHGHKYRWTKDHRIPVIEQYKNKRKIVRSHELKSHHKIPVTAPHIFTGHSVLSVSDAALVGFLVTDGYFRWRGNSFEAMLYQKKPSVVEWIRTTFGSYIMSESVHPDTGVICFRLSAASTSAIQPMFRSKEDLPSIVTRLGKEECLAMYEAMMLAEGTETEGCTSFPQNDGPVIDAFQILCYMLGKAGHIRNKNCGNSTQKAIYVKRRDKISVHKWVRGEEKYVGKVWCPVTENSTWVMRQDGCVLITGNTEINAPRYVRMMQNTAFEEGGQAGYGRYARAAGVGAVRTGVVTAKLAAKAMLLSALMEGWNRSMYGDEDKELRRKGDRNYLIIGRRDDGSIRTLKFAGAMKDMLEWAGLEDFPRDIDEMIAGDRTIGDELIEVPKAAINKVAQGMEPVTKTMYELWSGEQVYPTIFPPKSEIGFASRPIRDRKGHVARVLSSKGLYDAAYSVYAKITGAPKMPAREWSKDPVGQILDWTIAYRLDPNETMFWATKQDTIEWAKKNGKSMPAMDPTEKSNALFYYKQAIKIGDEKAASDWRQKYMDLGGTEDGLKTSIEKAHPLSALGTNEEKLEYVRQLTPEKKQDLKQALAYYNGIYLLGGQGSDEKSDELYAKMMVQLNAAGIASVKEKKDKEVTKAQVDTALAARAEGNNTLFNQLPTAAKNKILLEENVSEDTKEFTTKSLTERLHLFTGSSPLDQAEMSPFLRKAVGQLYAKAVPSKRRKRRGTTKKPMSADETQLLKDMQIALKEYNRKKKELPAEVQEQIKQKELSATKALPVVKPTSRRKHY